MKLLEPLVKSRMTNIPLTSLGNQRLRKSSKNLLTHQFENENGDEYAGTGFGDFGLYMANKRRKLQNQAQELILQQNKAQESDPNMAKNYRLEISENKTIFQGCVIYINGYTGIEYSSEELQRMIVLHGGVHIQHMVGKTSVTHIIATTLTARKKQEFANYRVVLPSWINRCIQESRLLDWKEFRTVPEMLPKGQTKLFADKSDHDAPQSKYVSASTFKISDPDFIKHYYLNSRLHHLSMWKAAVRQKYLTKASLFADSIYTPHAKSKHSAKVFLHVDFDCFFASVAIKLRPEISESSPLCVASGTHDKSDIASCNYEARKYGVKNGMGLGRAKAICPEMVVIPCYDFEAYEKASLDMYDILMELGADYVYPVSVDEAMLDVTEIVTKQMEESDSLENTGSQSSPNGSSFGVIPNKVTHFAKKLGESLKAQIWNKTGLSVSVGIGSNILLARVALANAKPAGVYVINWETRFNDLMNGKKKLELRDLPGVGYSIVKKLASPPFNIASYKDLVSFSCESTDKTKMMGKKQRREQLERAFGPKTGTKLWEFGQGIGDTDLREYIEVAMDRKSIGVEISWGVRAETQGEVDAFIRNLCQELSSRLAGGGVSSLSKIMLASDTDKDINTVQYKGSQMTVKVYKAKENADPMKAKYMGHGQCDIISKSKSVFPSVSPTRDESVLTELALSIYNSINCAPHDLRGIGIQMTKLVNDTEAKGKGKGKVNRPGNQNTLGFVSKHNPNPVSNNQNGFSNRQNIGVKTPQNRTVPESLNMSNFSNTNKISHNLSPLAVSTPVSETIPTTHVGASQIDWDTYYALPNTIRRVVKDTYNLINTPRKLTNNLQSPTADPNQLQFNDFVAPTSRPSSNSNTNIIPNSTDLIAPHAIFQPLPKTPTRSNLPTRQEHSPQPLSIEALSQSSVHSNDTVCSVSFSSQLESNEPVHEKTPKPVKWKRFANDGGIWGGQYTLTQQFLAKPSNDENDALPILDIPPLQPVSNQQVQPVVSKYSNNVYGFGGESSKTSNRLYKSAFRPRRRGRPPLPKVFTNQRKAVYPENANNLFNNGRPGLEHIVNEHIFEHSLNSVGLNSQINYFDHPSIIDPTVLCELPSTIVSDLQNDLDTRKQQKLKKQARAEIPKKDEDKPLLLNEYRRERYRNTLAAPVLDTYKPEEESQTNDGIGLVFELNSFPKVCQVVREWIKETSQKKVLVKTLSFNQVEMRNGKSENRPQDTKKLAPLQLASEKENKPEHKRFECSSIIDLSSFRTESDKGEDLGFDMSSSKIKELEEFFMDDVDYDCLNKEDINDTNSEKSDDVEFLGELSSLSFRNDSVVAANSLPTQQDSVIDVSEVELMMEQKAENDKAQALKNDTNLEFDDGPATDMDDDTDTDSIKSDQGPSILVRSSIRIFKTSGERAGIKFVAGPRMSQFCVTTPISPKRYVAEVLEPGPHPADLSLFYAYSTKLASDPLRWINAAKLVRWVMSEVEDITGCKCWSAKINSDEKSGCSQSRNCEPSLDKPATTVDGKRIPRLVRRNAKPNSCVTDCKKISVAESVTGQRDVATNSADPKTRATPLIAQVSCNASILNKKHGKQNEGNSSVKKNYKPSIKGLTNYRHTETSHHASSTRQQRAKAIRMEAINPPITSQQSTRLGTVAAPELLSLNVDPATSTDRDSGPLSRAQACGNSKDSANGCGIPVCKRFYCVDRGNLNTKKLDNTCGCKSDGSRCARHHEWCNVVVELYTLVKQTVFDTHKLDIEI